MGITKTVTFDNTEIQFKTSSYIFPVWLSFEVASDLVHHPSLRGRPLAGPSHRALMTVNVHETHYFI